MRILNRTNNYKNRKKYDLVVKAYETIIKTCKAVVTAMQSDINVLMKLNDEAFQESIGKTKSKDEQRINSDSRLKVQNNAYNKWRDDGLK